MEPRVSGVAVSVLPGYCYSSPHIPATFTTESKRPQRLKPFVYSKYGGTFLEIQNQAARKETSGKQLLRPVPGARARHKPPMPGVPGRAEAPPPSLCSCCSGLDACLLFAFCPTTAFRRQARLGDKSLQASSPRKRGWHPPPRVTPPYPWHLVVSAPVSAPEPELQGPSWPPEGARELLVLVGPLGDKGHQDTCRCATLQGWESGDPQPGAPTCQSRAGTSAPPLSPIPRTEGRRFPRTARPALGSRSTAPAAACLGAPRPPALTLQGQSQGLSTRPGCAGTDTAGYPGQAQPGGSPQRPPGQKEVSRQPRERLRVSPGAHSPSLDAVGPHLSLLLGRDTAERVGQPGRTGRSHPRAGSGRLRGDPRPRP